MANGRQKQAPWGFKKGVGDFVKRAFLSLQCIPSWTWLCHFNQNSPNDTIFGNVPQKTGFYVTAGCWWFGLMKLIPLFLLPQVVQRPHESCAALHAMSFELLWTHTDCSIGSCRWLKCKLELKLELNPSIVLCQSILFPLHLQVSPLSPSVPVLTYSSTSKCFSRTGYPKLFDKICLGGAVFAFFSA